MIGSPQIKARDPLGLWASPMEVASPNLDGKSDLNLFLTLFEERTAQHVRTLIKRMKTTRTTSENLQSLREFYVCQANDRAWAIPTLECKLLATRHSGSSQDCTGILVRRGARDSICSHSSTYLLCLIVPPKNMN